MKPVHSVMINSYFNF